ncbi:VIR-like CYIR protein [Plasmodium cynomolgi strain B]|uniref:VIR-like CYIR protein n=1 Tax=Plasmodium cynomolgi (strain B) TaxID=1120755 RepID=K6UCB0_PLACD|nr:VIR-like CYIR protein [Plasmodium cynomolgi strain B]GAB64536.1 VIR-like CYIR protein [Plasmodium cynomolgi strain B]
MENIDEKTYGYIPKLIDLYSNISNISTLHNDTWKSDENKNFCNELEKFQKRNNVAMKSVNNCGDEHKYLSSFQDSPIVAVSVIPIIIMYVISFILFISCKISAYFVHK